MKPVIVIFGLGNPGKSHEKTRHNIGFRAIDALSDAFGGGEWKHSSKFNAIVQEGRVASVPILLVKPQTSMNLSGASAQMIVDDYGLDPRRELLVLCDDVDLPLGTLRLRRDGGPGTHNGLRSLAERFGEGYPRIRIGLGTAPKGADLAPWVLSNPSEEEAKTLQGAIEKIPGMTREFIFGQF